MGVYRAGYQPIKAPAAVKAYGVAAKWANGGSARTSTGPTASDLFFGPRTQGTDWNAVFATAFGGTRDTAFSEYVKRNVDKFSGGVLEAMLVQSNLVDWYKEKMQKDAAELAKSLQKTIESVDLASLQSDRAKDILASLTAKDRPVGAFSGGSATSSGSVVDVQV